MYYDEECWAPVPVEKFADHFEISSWGRVRNNKTGNLLSTKVTRAGAREGVYLQVTLTMGAKARSCRSVSQMVMLAFSEPPRWGETRVGHLDGDSLNCNAANLYWIPSRKRYLEFYAYARYLAGPVASAVKYRSKLR
jgi:hypothetical protein